MAPLTIETRTEGDRTVVTIAGVVDEHADLGALDALAGRVELDVAGVRRLNSPGVRTWVDAIRGLGQRAQVTFVGCSTAIVAQLNMITGFLGNGRVESFHGAMRCPSCDTEVLHLFRRTDCEHALPEVRCASCGGVLELDDDEDQYLLFLREPTRVA